MQGSDLALRGRDVERGALVRVGARNGDVACEELAHLALVPVCARCEQLLDALLLASAKEEEEEEEEKKKNKGGGQERTTTNKSKEQERNDEPPPPPTTTTETTFQVTPRCKTPLSRDQVKGYLLGHVESDLPPPCVGMWMRNEAVSRAIRSYADGHVLGDPVSSS